MPLSIDTHTCCTYIVKKWINLQIIKYMSELLSYNSAANTIYPVKKKTFYDLEVRPKGIV